jgi:DNA-binding SARP family transcriptional activator
LSAQPNHRLAVSVIGGCAFGGADGKAFAIKSRKARALIGVLAVSPGMALPRDKLAGLFWSEFDQENARASLRQCVKIIRQELGPALEHMVTSDRELLSLDRSAISTDYHSMMECADAGRHGDPVFQTEEVHDRLFSGMEDVDEAFAAWVAVFREKARRHLQASMEAAIAATAVTGDDIAAAQALLCLDPAHEPALRYLMHAEMRMGNRAAALRLFELFRDRLRQDYDASPEPQTLGLYKAVRQEIQRDLPLGEPDELPQNPALAETPVIAVVSELSSAEPAGAGFVFAVLGVLSRFRNFSVISLPSDAAKAENGGGHQTDYVLEIKPALENGGSAYFLRLFDGPSGKTLWTRSVSASAGQLAASQETIVRGICGALNVYISENQMQRLKIKDPHSQNAIEKWLHGQHLLGVWQPDTDLQAERLFLEAIHAAPDHAPLHANLADVYNSRHIVFPGIRRDPKLEVKAMQLARRAVALDALDPRSHVTLGWSLALAEKPVQAVYSFLRGHELNPADSVIAMSAAHGLAICGELHRAYELKAVAFSCHPSPPWTFWGFDAHIRFLAADYAGAVDAVEHSGEIKSNFLGWKSAALGMLDSAEAQMTALEFVARSTERWSAKDKPSPENVTSWFLNIFPFARMEARQSLREGLRKAGLPV